MGSVLVIAGLMASGVETFSLSFKYFLSYSQIDFSHKSNSSFISSGPAKEDWVNDWPRDNKNVYVRNKPQTSCIT